MPRTYSLTKYRAEATREPFVLELDEGSTLTIPQPSVDEILDITGMVNVRAQLKILAKDQYDDLIKHIGDLPGGLVKPLVRDILDHYGLGE